MKLKPVLYAFTVLWNLANNLNANESDKQGRMQVFADQFRKAVANEDRERVAESIAYPIVINVRGDAIRIEDKREFLERYNQIITQYVKNELAGDSIRSDFPNSYLGLVTSVGHERKLISTGQGIHRVA